MATKNVCVSIVNDGKKLPPWHPLISGSKKSVETVLNYAISETKIKNMNDLEDYVLELQS